jgi:hypothetical protein
VGIIGNITGMNDKVRHLGQPVNPVHQSLQYRDGKEAMPGVTRCGADVCITYLYEIKSRIVHILEPGFTKKAAQALFQMATKAAQKSCRHFFGS